MGPGGHGCTLTRPATAGSWTWRPGCAAGPRTGRLASRGSG